MSDDQKNEQDKPSFVPEPKEKKDEKKGRIYYEIKKNKSMEN